MKKQLFYFKTWLMLCLLFIGAGSAWADTTVSMTSFTAVSGKVGGDANVSYEAAKGGAATAPAVNSNEIRVYQNGGLFTVTAAEGYKLKSVTIGSSMATSINYKLDGGSGEVLTSDASIAANKTYTVSNIDNTSVQFICKGKDKNSRLYVNSLSVTYAAESTDPTPTEKTLVSIKATGTAEVLWKGDAFNHNGITVTATWDDETETDVTSSCSFSGYDMNTVGQQTVTATYKEKTCTYGVEVKTIANTQATAYTVEEAIALIDAGKGLNTEVYVKGTVCKIESKSVASDGSLNFWISSDGGTTAQQFELYKNKKSDTEGWSSLDEINVGDDLVAYGKLTLYKSTSTSTYEFAAGNYLVYLNHIEIPSHTASFSVNGQVDAKNDYEGKERTAITFPAVGDQDGMTFIGWSLTKVSATAVEPTLVDTKTAVFGEEDVTFYAVFATKIEGKKTVTEDVLNRALIGVTGTTYKNWSGKTVTDGSGAVYAGYSSGGNSAIQLNSKNPTGIITTASGGIITKVKVSWNSNTDTDRTIDVYGKTSAYSSGTDLYNTAAGGTKVGSIKIGTSTELTIDLSEGYTYVGIRSNNGALYLDNITFEWTDAEPDTYRNYCTEYTTASLKAEANGCKYATFSSKDNVVIPAEDNNATYNVYAVGVEDDHIVLSDFVADFENADAGNAIVPSGTGVMIKATPKEGKTVSSVACAITDQEGNGYDTSLNNLIACTTTGQLLTAADGNTYYKLAYGTSDAHSGELGFYWGAAEGAGTFNVKAGGAVLKIDGAAAVRGFSFDAIEDTEDGIFNVNENVNDNKEIYNLAGQRIQKLQKGINIVGGKKILK